MFLQGVSPSDGAALSSRKQLLTNITITGLIICSTFATEIITVRDDNMHAPRTHQEQEQLEQGSEKRMWGQEQ